MPDRSHPPRPRRVGYWLALVVSLTINALLLLILLADTALAQPQVAPLNAIIDRLQQVITSLLVGLATFFLTMGGVRYLFAGGDPSQVEKAKVTLRSAAIGYGIAALSVPLFNLLRYIVGSP